MQRCNHNPNVLSACRAVSLYVLSCDWVPPVASVKMAVHQHSRAGLCNASIKYKNRERRHSQNSHHLRTCYALGRRSVRFLFRYAVSRHNACQQEQRYEERPSHLLTSIIFHNYLRDNCICSPEIQKTSEAAAMGKSHQECYIGES